MLWGIAGTMESTLGNARAAGLPVCRRPIRQIPRFMTHMAHPRALSFAAAALVSAVFMPLPTSAQSRDQPAASDGTTTVQDKEKAWSVSAEAGMLNDDSVAVDAVDNRSGQADQARVLKLGGKYKLFENSFVPLKLSYDFSKTSYQDLPAFDQQSHTGFISTGWRVSKVDIGLLYGYSHTALDGKPFLNFHTFTPTLGYGLTTNWYALAGYNYQNKTFHTAKARNAHVQGLSLDNFIFFNNTLSYFKFGYRAETENTAANQFDFLGHYFNAGLKSTLSDSLGAATLQFSYQYYLKNYTKETAAIGAEREDQRHSIKAEISVPFHTHADLKFSYKYVKAHSNVTTADFDENVINASIALNF